MTEKFDNIFKNPDATLVCCKAKKSEIWPTLLFLILKLTFKYGLDQWRSYEEDRTLLCV